MQGEWNDRRERPLTEPRSKENFKWPRRSSFPTTTPTTIATRSRSAGSSAFSGAELSLAYVRHRQQADQGREAEAQKRAEARLEHGATAVGAPDMQRHVVVHASTGEGLIELADPRARRRCRLRVRLPHRTGLGFPGDLRAADAPRRPGRRCDRPGRPALPLVGQVNTIGVLDDGDEAARATAESLAGTLGASVSDADGAPIDLLVVGSRPETPLGRVGLSAASEYEVETAAYPVLVTPRGTTVRFSTPQAPESPAVPASV